MMDTESPPTVEMISLDQIEVVNPRLRNAKVFREIVENIAAIGLKRPITVSRQSGSGGGRFDLVCGQGRIEAYKALNQTSIPAIVIDATSQDCMVMSLVENLARRQHRGVDLLRDIEGLKRRGYDEIDIAAKTDLTLEYVRGVIRLLENGEHRLLRAVESGHLPLSVAVEIAEANDAEVQRVLHEAYERKLLRGNRLAHVKRLLAQRHRRGKGLDKTGSKRPLSVERLLRTYRDDAEKKRSMVRKADITKGKLVFVIEALRTLFNNEHFLTLLRAEGLETLPGNIGARICGDSA
jgi:ParB family transcriptional regulator, chromosome partitioning protein